MCTVEYFFLSPIRMLVCGEGNRENRLSTWMAQTLFAIPIPPLNPNIFSNASLPEPASQTPVQPM